MIKRATLTVFLVMVLGLSALAWAEEGPPPVPPQGPEQGYDQPGGPPPLPPQPPGQGYGRPGGPMAGFKEDPAALKIHQELREKQRELFNLLAQDQLDEAKIKGLHQELNALRNKLADKRLEHFLAFRKENPDWKPWFGPRGGRGGGGFRRGSY
ncbi:MAG: periplasmic heavy metal sensor [Thermodesulfobacteriota bacterium]